jgi:DNA polymerase-1
MKIAMIRAVEGLRSASLSSRLLLQVHDELIFEVSPGETERLRVIVEDAMEHAVVLTVPLDVQIGLGLSWKEAGH